MSWRANVPQWSSDELFHTWKAATDDIEVLNTKKLNGECELRWGLLLMAQGIGRLGGRSADGEVECLVRSGLCLKQRERE